MQDGSPVGQEQAVLAIAEVGLLPDNRPLIADSNGIPSLSALLTSSVVGTPELAARALANLAHNGLTTPDDGGAPPDGEEVDKRLSEMDLAGRERRCEIQRVGAITKLIGMLQTVSLSGAITANKMWGLVRT